MHRNCHAWSYDSAFRDNACCSQVARRTFIRALNDKRSVILVPGGQAELIHTGRLRSRKEFVIYPKHQGKKAALLPFCNLFLRGSAPCEALCLLCAGFVRLAMQQNAKGGPGRCLGELSARRNFVDLPGMQVRALPKRMRPSHRPPLSIAPVTALPPARSLFAFCHLGHCMPA